MMRPTSTYRFHMGCLFVILSIASPRFAFFVFWILRPERVSAAFDTWVWPLLGLTFLPFATLLYVILYTPGVTLGGWEWFWIAMAGLLDIAHWAGSAVSQRAKVA